MTEREQLLDFYDHGEKTDAKNLMGCSENWYNPLYAITNTFDKSEIQDMSDETISALMKLADAISEALF